MEYRLTQCNLVFEEIYELTISKLKATFKEIARSLKSNVPEVNALYEDVLMRCIDTYSGEHDFENYYMLSVKNKRANLYRDRKTRRQREVAECELKKTDDEGAATLEVISMETPENLQFKKKRADQRQLISSLLEKSDESTKAIVETFLVSERPTPTAIGKMLGVHHMTVIRKLEKLAGNFDSKQFGDYRDYLFAN